MVAVGGATRLTGSGLSITEWRPVTGAIPPLSDAGWATEFDKYRASPQYELLNRGMSLGEFKSIFWWEWGHRQLGRLIGLAFFVPLLWFSWKRLIDRRLALTLLGIGALGAFQAAIGWIMVASGLQPGMTAVAPVKLALHLLTAGLILASLVAVALRGLAREPVARSVRRGAWVLVALAFLQIGLGGLVAGSKAGWVYNTWPLMDGMLIPPTSVLFSGSPWIENFFDNLALVQLNHRFLGYVLLAAAFAHAVVAQFSHAGSDAARRAMALAGLVLGQAVLGIVTLILVVPLWAGLAHQVLGLTVLASAVAHATLCAPSKERAGRADAPVLAQAI
jgi:cytochrome c oxidase assembly protein subunit 15